MTYSLSLSSSDVAASQSYYYYLLAPLLATLLELLSYVRAALVECRSIALIFIIPRAHNLISAERLLRCIPFTKCHLIAICDGNLVRTCG